METFIAMLGKGIIFTEKDLSHLAAWLMAVAQMKRYMATKASIAPTISGYAESLLDCPQLRAELDRCLRYGKLTDQASPELEKLAEESAPALHLNLEAMAVFDFIFARGKLAQAVGGKPVELSEQPVIRLEAAKHPLLGKDAVPLSVEIGDGYRQLMITGPNTGGKTVVLKTLGLLALMVQSGFLVPVGENSRFGVFTHIFADVGDGQSISQSLSTFSAHICTVTEMLKHADEGSLLLLDELAAGTDPGEGIALSLAILEELLS